MSTTVMMAACGALIVAGVLGLIAGLRPTPVDLGRPGRRPSQGPMSTPCDVDLQVAAPPRRSAERQRRGHEIGHDRSGFPLRSRVGRFDTSTFTR